MDVWSARGTYMAEIVCVECKTTVSDLSGYCPECGFPFDAAGMEPDSGVAGNAEVLQQKGVEVVSPDTFSQSLDLLRAEVMELRGAVGDIRQSFDSQAAKSAESTLKLLSEVNGKLDVMASAKSAQEKEALATAQKKPSSETPKTAGFSNAMSEYMFYMCAAQLVFVIVNLFLVAYIVTLVRD
jgi:hypothetical protein